MKVQFISLGVFLLGTISIWCQPKDDAMISFAFFDVTNGKSVPSLKVSLRSDSETDKANISVNLITGKIIKQRLPFGMYTAEIVADGYKTMIAKVVIGPDSPTNQIFNLSPLQKDYRLEPDYIVSNHQKGYTFINGFIVTEEGEPIPKAKVSSRGISTFSKYDGYFEISIPVSMEEEGEIIVEKETFCDSRQVGILIWSEGDWQTIFRLKKKDYLDDAPIIFDYSNPLIQLKDKPELNERESILKSNPEGVLSCLPNSVRVGFSSTGGNCCPGGNAGFPPCTTIETFMLDDYVKRVLPNEWIASWGTVNAFKAASVAIRSYTVNRINHPVYSNYDICSSPCCQNFGNTNTTTSSAVDATSGYVLQKSNGDVALAEYSAENNHKFPVCSGNSFSTNCSDGQFSWGGNCYQDPVSIGKNGFGHGRGMSQRGSARWSSGKQINSCSNTILSTDTGLGTKNWQEILALYYPNLALVSCSSSGGIPDLSKTFDNLQVSGNSVTFTVTIKNVGNATANASSLGFFAAVNSNFSSASLLGANNIPAIAPNSSHTITRTINLCDAASALNNGTYYVGYRIDRLNEVIESNENNNNFHWPNNPITINCSISGGSGNASVQAYLVCSDVIAAGGQWRIDGGAWKNSNEIVSNLSAGNHIISFKEIPGWVSPTSYTFTLANGEHKILSHPQTQYSKIFLLSLSSSPYGGGTTSGGGAIVWGCPSSTNVSISATPSSGWEFENWTENGVIFAYQPNISISISSDRQLVANFKQINTFNITTIPNPIEGGLCCFGSWNLPAGSSVWNEALPKPGWQFVNWTENGVVVSTNPSFSANVNANRIFYANFITTVGVGDLNLSHKVHIYPNPSSGSFSIHVDEQLKVKEVEIISILGQVLKKIVFFSPPYNVENENLPSGTYFLRVITNDGGIATKKLIVNN